MDSQPTTKNKFNFIRTLFITSCFVFLLSCDRPACENTNTVFNQFAPETEEYKTELAKQLTLQKASDLTFWFDSFQSHHNKEYILVNIQGEQLCAKGWLLVTDWKTLQGIKETRGVGYHGAELIGLKIDIKKDSVSTELIAMSVERIVD